MMQTQFSIIISSISITIQAGTLSDNHSTFWSIFLFPWPWHMTCEILVLQLGTEHGPNPTAKEFPSSIFFFFFFYWKLLYLELASWTQFRWSQFCWQHPKHHSQEPVEHMPSSLHQSWSGCRPLSCQGHCCSSVAKLCLTLCSPVDCSTPGSMA